MVLGQVIGNVVCTQKDSSLEGKKLMVVKAVDLEGKLLDPFVVAVDLVGVGIGERVLVVNGSSARMTERTREKSIDSVIVAKVDSIKIGQ
ncbi:MAG: EutN/CcmL family microcompartment protein [Actinomycetota bacterium]|jgi:microcompartment protein CcmK/EutM|nr:EutN/CcmL family microcompartment protein [Actinomycetota bacterium]